MSGRGGRVVAIACSAGAGVTLMSLECVGEGLCVMVGGKGVSVPGPSDSAVSVDVPDRVGPISGGVVAVALVSVPSLHAGERRRIATASNTRNGVILLLAKREANSIR